MKQIEFAPRYFVDRKGLVYSKCSGDLRILSPYYNKGYAYVSLCYNGCTKKHAVHRLVADAFLGKVAGKNVVNHKNGKRDDNRLENIEWVTQKENVNHAISSGYWWFAGENAPWSSNTEYAIRQACELLAEDLMTYRDIEIKTGVDITTLSNLCHGQCWSSVTCDYNLKPKKRTRLSEKEVVEMCHLINYGVEPDEISKMYDGYPVPYIKDMKTKNRHKRITRQLIH